MRSQRSTRTLLWSATAWAALLLLSGCAGLRLPFLGEADPVLDQRSRVEEEFGRPVAFGVGIASGKDDREACRLARLAALENGLDVIADAGLDPGKKPYVKDQLIVDQSSCFVTVKWPKLSTRSLAHRGAPQSVVISVAQQPTPAAAGPETTTPGLRSSAAAPVATPAPGTTQIQPQVAQTILYFDLRQGEAAEAPRPSRVERPLADTTLSAGAGFGEDGEDRNDFGIGVGFVDPLGFEVPVSIPVRQLLDRKLSFELLLAPGYLTDLPSGGISARAELALVAHPFKFSFATPYASAGVGARAAYDFDLGDVSILAEPAFSVGSFFPAFRTDVRLSMIVPVEISDPIDIVEDGYLSLAALYRF